MSVKSGEFFEKMSPLLETYGADIVKKVGAVFLWEIRANKDAEPVFYTVDLKNGNGKITKGKEGKPDTTFVILDDDLVGVLSQKTNPQ